MINTDNAIDLVAMALQLGASFVARSFSGDKTQLVPIIEAAIEHQGAAFIDVITPCVAFNNHAGSTKSFDYVREHNEAVNRLDVITGRAPITVDYAPGTVQVVEQHDGTKLALRKLDADYDVHDRLAAMSFLQKHAAKGQVVTGLLYVDPDAEDLHAHLNTVETPLNALAAKELCPGSAALEKINAACADAVIPDAADIAARDSDQAPEPYGRSRLRAGMTGSVRALPDVHLLVGRVVADAFVQRIGMNAVGDAVAEAIDRRRLVDRRRLGQRRRRIGIGRRHRRRNIAAAAARNIARALDALLRRFLLPHDAAAHGSLS